MYCILWELKIQLNSLLKEYLPTHSRKKKKKDSKTHYYYYFYKLKRWGFLWSKVVTAAQNIIKYFMSLDEEQGTRKASTIRVHLMHLRE